VTTDPYPLDAHFIQRAGEVLAHMRATSPVREVATHPGDVAWLISRHADAAELYSDPRLIQAPETAAELGNSDAVPISDPANQLLIHNMLYRDGADHTRLRRAVSGAFTPAAVARLQQPIEEYVTRLLDDIGPADPVDLMTAFCSPIPMFVISEILGIPESDRDQFASWAHDINNQPTIEAWRNSTIASANYLRGLIDEKRAHPTSDILSELITIADHGDLSPDELISTAILLVFAGSDTTVGLLANSVISLLSAPDQLAAVLDHPELLDKGIDELLRHGSPVNITIPRYPTEPITIDGVTIPRGAQILLSLQSANHDHHQFPDPDRLDLNRATNGHLAFGRGAHYCIGAPLARLEGRIALGLLLRRFPTMRLATDPASLPRRDSLLMNTVTTLPIHLHT
jgi:cytochrome P450